MARDETARETDSEQALLERGPHLRLAGAAATVVADDRAGREDERGAE